MRIRDYLMSDELQSAVASGRRLMRIATSTGRFWTKHILGSAPFLLIGGLVGYWFCYVMVTRNGGTEIKDIATGVLTFEAVLAGFMVTLMLFSGKTEGTSSLTVNDAPGYVDKLTYLLFSQMYTLVVSLMCSISAIGWMMADRSNMADIYRNMVVIATFSLLGLSAARVLLLPFQIYELHSFVLDAFIAEKRLEAKKRHQASETDVRRGHDG